MKALLLITLSPIYVWGNEEEENTNKITGHTLAAAGSASGHKGKESVESICRQKSDKIFISSLF